jgi:hypothetical protein
VLFSMYYLSMTKKKRCILAVVYIIYVVAYFLVVKPNWCYNYPYRTYWMPQVCLKECNKGEFEPGCCPPDTIEKCWFPSLIKNLTNYDIKWGWQFRIASSHDGIKLQILFLCFMIFLPIGILFNKKWVRILFFIISLISISLFIRYFSTISNQSYSELQYQRSRPV